MWSDDCIVLEGRPQRGRLLRGPPLFFLHPNGTPELPG